MKRNPEGMIVPGTEWRVPVAYVIRVYDPAKRVSTRYYTERGTWALERTQARTFPQAQEARDWIATLCHSLTSLQIEVVPKLGNSRAWAEQPLAFWQGGGEHASLERA
jgi:hypothetical protein